MAEPRPRTRANRLKREPWMVDHKKFGVASMPLTCPRCGWACTYLLVCYWDSPWNKHGGICGQCIKEAATVYDAKGWPVDPRDAKPEPSERIEKVALFDE